LGVSHSPYSGLAYKSVTDNLDLCRNVPSPLMTKWSPWGRSTSAGVVSGLIVHVLVAPAGATAIAALMLKTQVKRLRNCVIYSYNSLFLPRLSKPQQLNNAYTLLYLSINCQYFITLMLNYGKRNKQVSFIVTGYTKWT